MKKILAFLCTAMTFATVTPVMAEYNEMHKMNAECQEMDNEVRKSLQECLQNKDISTKKCIKHAKKIMKKQKKAYKKELSRKIMNGEIIETMQKAE